MKTQRCSIHAFLLSKYMTALRVHRRNMCVAIGMLILPPLLMGCVLAPAGTELEREKLAAAGVAFEPKVTERDLPALSPEPTWPELLHRAFLANGDLETAYFEWKAAVTRIEIAAGYPNTNAVLGYSYAVSSDRMKSFDRMTFAGGFDGMENLSFPTKVMQAGKVALDEARVSGERFRAAKFALQKRVLTAWADYILLVEQLRIERENLNLLKLVFDTASARVQAGASQHDLLRAEIAYRMSEDKFKSLQSQQAASLALLNGMLARKSRAPLEVPKRLPAPRPLVADDATILLAGVDQNPDLAALARQIEGRHNALELAKMQWIPDINPNFALTGGAVQVIGAAIVLPTTFAEIRGTIKESKAMLRASESTLRQTRFDRAASFVATLVALRDSERQAALFSDQILPAAQRVLENIRQSYVAGGSTYLDLIEGQRTLLEVQLVIAQARAMREMRLAELEALAGIDFETLAPHTGPVAAKKDEH